MMHRSMDDSRGVSEEALHTVEMYVRLDMKSGGYQGKGIETGFLMTRD